MFSRLCATDVALICQQASGIQLRRVSTLTTMTNLHNQLASVVMRFVQSTRGAWLHPWSFGTRAREKWHLGQLLTRFPGCHVSCWLCSVTWKKHLETLWSFQSICKHGTVCHMVQNVHTSNPFSRSVSPSLSSLSLYQYARILVWVYLSTVIVSIEDCWVIWMFFEMPNSCLVKRLLSALRENPYAWGLDLKLIAWDHNRDDLFLRAHTSLGQSILFIPVQELPFSENVHISSSRVASASFSELGDDSIAWSGFTVILMLPNTSGAWAGTGVLDSKVAGGVSLLYFLLFDIWGFIKNPVLSITSSGEIGFWEHDIEASEMQGRARGHKGEAQGVLSYQKVTGIFDNPHSCTDDTDVSSLFCCNSFSGFISSTNFNFQLLALKILE